MKRGAFRHLLRSLLGKFQTQVKFLKVLEKLERIIPECPLCDLEKSHFIIRSSWCPSWWFTGPETILLVRHFLCFRPEGSQENEGLHRWRIQEWKRTQAPLVDQWVWGCQDYRQLLKDAGVIPSQESFVAWTLSRTMNYANGVQGTQNL